MRDHERNLTQCQRTLQRQFNQYTRGKMQLQLVEREYQSVLVQCQPLIDLLSDAAEF
jgi:hypothetical protein